MGHLDAGLIKVVLLRVYGVKRARVFWSQQRARTFGRNYKIASRLHSGGVELSDRPLNETLA
jgi:hypothetical protein